MAFWFHPRFLTALGLLAFGLVGCAGYQVGPTNGLPARSRSIQVNLFQNRTPEPRLSEAVAHALRKRFSQEATFRLASQQDGDIIVHGVITDFIRAPLSFQRNDVITVQDYDVYLTVQVIAEERGTGRRLLNQAVTGRASVRLEADQGNVERQVLPVVADNLAYNISALLADGTW